MESNIEIWRKQIAERLPGWEQRIIVTGFPSVYCLLAAIALLSLVEVTQNRDEQLQDICEELFGNNEGCKLLMALSAEIGGKVDIEIARILLGEVEKKSELKPVLDVLLKDTQVLQQAKEVLQEKDRIWFDEIIRQERSELNSLVGMQFCYVPSGAFIMEGVLGEMVLPEYWIGRYLVTNAQYAYFVEAGGYDNPAYWAEAQEAGIWYEGSVKGRWDREARQKPKNYLVTFNTLNRPVVGITWYEMLAFTRWLEENWREKDMLPSGWQVLLPSENEWEKAARGGLDTGYEVNIQTAGQLGKVLQGKTVAQEEASLVSIVECAQEENSPYGLVGLNGAVWDWTRSGWTVNPGQPYDGRKLLWDAVSRVLRGGAEYKKGKYKSCQYRDKGDPAYWYFYVGFRVVLSKI